MLAAVLALVVIAASCSSDSTTEVAESESTASSTAADQDSTTTVETGTEPEAEDPEPEAEAPEADEPAAEGFPGVTAVVEAFVEARGLEGAGLIVVHKDDGVLYEEYFGTFTADRISMIASASKMVSAGVLLRLQDDGLLDVNAPIEGVVDWAIGNPDITPAQLISNSSGLVGLGPDLLYAPYLCQWGVPNTLQECGEAVFSSSADDADQIPPDTEFRYGGAQWQVAGAVAEAVSGRTWGQLIEEIYVGPCEVNSLGYISLGAVPIGPEGYPVAFGGDPDSVTPSENPNVEGGAHINVSDYGKLLLMHLRGGTCGDEQVLSKASLDTMHADRISAAYDGNASAPDTGYGMGWWIDRETGRISDPGAWGAVPWLDLDDGYGAYLIIEDQSATGQALKGEIEDLVHEAVVGR